MTVPHMTARGQDRTVSLLVSLFNVRIADRPPPLFFFMSSFELTCVAGRFVTLVMFTCTQETRLLRKNQVRAGNLIACLYRVTVKPVFTCNWPVIRFLPYPQPYFLTKGFGFNYFGH